jgi:hypothetical protein
MEKKIAYPTNGRFYELAREELVTLAQEAGETSAVLGPACTPAGSAGWAIRSCHAFQAHAQGVKKVDGPYGSGYAPSAPAT